MGVQSSKKLCRISSPEVTCSAASWKSVVYLGATPIKVWLICIYLQTQGFSALIVLYINELLTGRMRRINPLFLLPPIPKVSVGEFPPRACNKVSQEPGYLVGILCSFTQLISSICSAPERFLCGSEGVSTSFLYPGSKALG